MQGTGQSDEQRIYRRCLFLLPLFILAVILFRMGYFTPAKFLPPCMFHALTGFSCPGCGCTRAVTALLQGDLFLSLRNNPSILYCVGLYILFILSHSVCNITKRLPARKGERSPFQILNHIHGMKCTPMYLYILVYLLLGFGVLRFLAELWQYLNS